MKICSQFRLPLSFFGLAASDKVLLHEELFTMVMASNGGFRWTELYEMPTYLRKFYLRKLKEWKEKETQQAEQGQGGNKFSPPAPGGKLPPILRPAIQKK